MRQRRHIGSIWLTIFSDMTTNLMLFFLILFAMTRMTMAERQMMVEGMETAFSDKSAQIKAQKEQILRRIREESAIENLEKIVSSGDLADHAEVNVYDDKVKITLNLPMFFASGSARLNKDALSILESLVNPFKEFPGDIIIEGHTDNVPIIGGAYNSNWELSIARAVSVIHFLTDRGLPASQIVAAGYGEYHPAYPNDTEDHRARNRRIEISIIRQSSI